MKRKSQQLRILSMTPSGFRPGEIAVDLFAGGGGWSEGFQWATGVPPAIAVNHDEHSIQMHTANHPETEHWHEDVFHVDPVKATRGRPVGWLHGSPDCRHFSRAKGSVPNTARALSKKIRGLAWVIVRWAAAVRPRIISLENVSEFTTWGPLHQQGRNAGAPMKRRKGETFWRFVRALESLGYVVEWRELKACDFGAPTSRKRLFLIARCDGQAIRWPEPTHGPGRSKPYRTAADCIDWSIPVQSIFGRKKPLADATLRRIAEGIRRFVLENPRPFLVRVSHGERRPGETPRCLSIDEPFPTITAAHRGEKALIAPTLIQTSYGERKGQRPRVLDLQQPLGTVVAGGQPLTVPLHTIPTKDRFALVAAFLQRFIPELTGDVVTVAIEGEVFAIVDIGMRMLAPRELARGNGFPDTYILTGTTTQQVARVGNSVPPHFARAIVAANLDDEGREEVAV